MLLTFEQVLPPAEAVRLGATLKTAAWRDGRASAGARAALVKRNLQLDDTAPAATAARQQILSALAARPDFTSAALPHSLFPPKFNYYQAGGHYGLHVDAALMSLPQGGQLRSDLAATLFLCAPDDYDGGELVVETAFGAQSVKLGAGDLVLYPASSLHRVEPVTRGARICSFFWLQSLVRSPERRALLFDLDQSIQALSAAQSNEVDRLSGIYHNLLREWAEI